MGHFFYSFSEYLLLNDSKHLKMVHISITMGLTAVAHNL